MVIEILKNVVNCGTGSQAKRAIKMELDLGIKDKKMIINIPTLGKTGTANEYSNSSYVGFIPTFCEGATDLTLENSFVIATYVGYDDNTPMKNNHLRIFGASGALPVWIDLANEIVNSPIYQSSIDPVDFAFLRESDLSLKPPPGAIPIPVDQGSGLPVSLELYLEKPELGVTLYSYGKREGSLLKLQRFFVPFPAPQVRGKRIRVRR